VSQTQTEDVGALLAGLLARHSVVDLTLPLADTLPCTWPGHMPFRATVWSWFAARPADDQFRDGRGAWHHSHISP
jgi:hypothetical protein